jgi:hypothetical protein
MRAARLPSRRAEPKNESDFVLRVVQHADQQPKDASLRGPDGARVCDLTLDCEVALPKERIQRDVGERRTAAEIADAHSRSEELAIYRIQLARLWQRYERYAA